MFAAQASLADPTAGYLKQRIGSKTSIVPIGEPLQPHNLAVEVGVTLDSEEFQQAVSLLENLQLGKSHGMPLSADSTLVLSKAELEAGRASYVIASVEGPPPVAVSLVETVLEAWNLQREVNSAQMALRDSAMQLAQSFEEQNWLRGFARNATSFSRYTNANDIAEGILRPLGYLLRAQDVYLLVDPAETERSGLESAKFGDSVFSVKTVFELAQSLGLCSESPPIVRNHMDRSTPDGEVLSFVGVSVTNGDLAIGSLVAINRSENVHSEEFPVYDPEFGSADVGILEEAAVLLTTQAQNIHLLVQSNQLFLGTLYAMSRAIDARDRYTQGHSERVARLSHDLAQLMGVGEKACQEIYLAGILHDIGKIGIPDRVLLKNGALSDDEFAVIREHPEIGYRIVERLGHLQFALPGVLYHHERWDGHGYPHQLIGDAIPLMARIMSVADAFDAMTSSRPYRSAMPIEKAQRIIKNGAGRQWDGDVVACFGQWLNGRKQEIEVARVGESVIPDESPVEHIGRAVMALVD